MTGSEGVAYQQELETGPGAAAQNPYMAIRTRFFDDFLVHVTNEHRIWQVVLLAAGMDARAFRLRWSPGTTIFELDQPEVLATKGALLTELNAQATCQRYVVGVDLSHSWAPWLTTAGYDPQVPSVWLLEGLLNYLTEATVQQLLTTITSLAAPQSWLGADVVSREFLHSPWMQPWLMHLAEHGAPWQFGTDDPEGLFRQHGWEATVTQPGEEAAHYGRWPYPVAPREVTGIPRSYLITAVRRAA